MNPKHLLPTLLLIAVALTGCQKSEIEQTPTLSFQERYEAAVERESALLGSMVTADMHEGTKNLINEFFPEAAAKIAREQNITQSEAETLLRKRMKAAADKCRDDYVKENGYGTIVVVLAVSSELYEVREVLESK